MGSRAARWKKAAQLLGVASPSTHSGERYGIDNALQEREAKRSTVSKREYWRYITEAVGMIVNGEYLDAVVMLASARKATDTPYVDALVGLAGLSGGRLDEGRALLERAVQRKPTEPMIYYWAARAAFADNRLALAHKRMAQALAAGGRDPVVFMGSALVALARRHKRSAMDALVEVARIQPNLLDARLYPTPDEGAVELLAGALADFPAPVHLMKTQGHLLFQLGKISAAMARFVAALKLRPGDPEALRMRALGYQRLGLIDKALAISTKAIEKSPKNAWVQATHGELLLAVNRPVEALSFLQYAAESLPDDVDTLSGLARACAATHDEACALRFYGYAYRRDSTNAAIAIDYAVVLQEAGRIGEALSVLRPIVHSNLAVTKAHELAAHLLRLKGKEKAAEKVLRSARYLRRARRRIETMEKRIDLLLSHLNAALTEKDKPHIFELRDPLRAQILAYHALQAGQIARARGLLTRVSAHLQPRRLLMADPTLLRITMRVGTTRQFVSQQLPVVHPAAVGLTGW